MAKLGIGNHIISTERVLSLFEQVVKDLKRIGGLPAHDLQGARLLVLHQPIDDCYLPRSRRSLESVHDY